MSAKVGVIGKRSRIHKLIKKNIRERDIEEVMWHILDGFITNSAELQLESATELKDVLKIISDIARLQKARKKSAVADDVDNEQAVTLPEHAVQHRILASEARNMRERRGNFGAVKLIKDRMTPEEKREFQLISKGR